jgi:SAM-dependent methyltransferase
MSTEEEDRERLGAIFADEDVAASYHGRAPYAPALFATLLAKVPGRGRALDLGCGPGKVARVLAEHFAEVVAVDPSAAMLAVGKADDAGAHSNIAWTRVRAEDYGDDARFDVATAGGSIHWFDPAVLFPKLARWTDVFAILDDAPIYPHPAPPCGMDAWIAFVNRWLPRIGRPAAVAPDDEPPLPSRVLPHERWMDVSGRERFRFRYRQSVEAFIAGNHSRVTWNRPQMGAALADAFDQELDAIMRPFAVDGVLELDAASELTWGAPKAAPRG